MDKKFRNVKLVNSEVELIKVSKNFKDVLDDIESINTFYSLKDFDSYVFSDYLKNIFFTFRMKLNRYQSLLLCERCYSYSIQSQRYCRYDDNAEVILEGLDDAILHSIDMECILDYLDDCLSIYRVLSKLKDGCGNKSKFKIEDFEYGIPIEDARYILPMAFTCNQIVTLNAMQVLDLLAITNRYNILKEIYLKLVNTEEIKLIMTKAMLIVPYTRLLTYRLQKSPIYNTDDGNNVELNFIDNLNIAGEAALTCTGKDINNNANLDKVATRVAGSMGHTSILDHVLLSYNGCLSVAAYNQLVRHRLQKMNRASFDIKIFDDPISEMIMPNTIKNKSREYLSKLLRGANLHIDIDNIEDLFKIYFDKFSEMIKDSGLLYTLSFRLFGDILLAPLFPMGTKVRFTVTNDLSNELYICSKRTCMKAQWEIRDFTYNKLKLLINEIGNKELFKQLAAPGCIKGKCPEGKECCGDNSLVKNIFLNI